MANEIMSSGVRPMSHRDFVKTAAVVTAGFLAACQGRQLPAPASLRGMPAAAGQLPVVGIVKTKGGKIEAAVEAVIDRPGGVWTIVPGRLPITRMPSLEPNDPRMSAEPTRAARWPTGKSGNGPGEQPTGVLRSGRLASSGKRKVAQ